MSVGFVDKEKDAQYYAERGYAAERTEIGYAYYPLADTEVTGEIGVRYEVKPWISRFEVDGIKPKPSAEDIARCESEVLACPLFLDASANAEIQESD